MNINKEVIMEKRWNLDQLYLSFQDQSFLNDIETLKQMLEDMQEYSQKEKTEDNLKSYLEQSNQFSDLVEKIYAFISLTMSSDTTNQDALKYSSVIENLLAGFADAQAKIDRWIGQFDLDHIQDSYIQEHLFVLKETQEHNRYLLSDEGEKILAQMKTTGSSAWLKYKDQLIAFMKVSMDGKEYPLTEVLNMAYSKDKEVRKKAYEAEIASYLQVEQGVASALNAIKGEAITSANLRGYDSVLQRTLIDSRMSQKTLDVLISTMKKALPMFERYFQLKAQALGYTDGLPWYELYAPIVESDMSYPFEKGSQFVVEQFYTFSKHLGDYAKKAIENQWIDVYPRTGKVGGAFCHNLHCIQESRFLLNYGNEFGILLL